MTRGTAAREGAQLGLFDLPPDPEPDLTWYDVILASISGGKDSMSMLRLLVARCTAAGIPLSRVVCVFADLGDDDEWPGTPEIAALHAAYYGLRFITVHRLVPDPDGGGKKPQSLIEHIWDRGMWPDPRNRYCTSDLKRGPIRTAMTMLANELRAAGTVTGRPVRILSVMGMRAQESVTRRLMKPFSHDESATYPTTRWVDEWLPIHSWTLEDIWDDIAESGVPYHYAYDIGLGRLSCVSCILAPRAALVLAARANPRNAYLRVLVEAEFVRRRAVITCAIAGAAVQMGRPPAWLAAPPAPPEPGEPVPAKRPLSVLARAWRSGPWFKQGLSMASVLAEAVAAGPLPPVVRGSRLRAGRNAALDWSG